MLIVGFIILIVGLMFMILAFSTGSDMLLLAFYGMGMLTIGFGIAAIVFAFALRHVQKMDELPPPPP